MLLLVLLLLGQAPASCSSVDDCRRQALAAEAAGDFETFHDLAWRAVQKGKPNDPDLMLLVARAMSLSGRPGDALVMLSRLADMGVNTDAATSDDFRRVRALKGWPELEAKIEGLPAPAAASAPAPATPSAPVAAAPSAPPAPAPAAPPAPVAPAMELSFAPAPASLSGLAYDAVSRRFLLGDRGGARLLVVDEPTHHMATLVGAAAAGFYDDLTAFDVDHRRGDLWVVSTKSDEGTFASVLHKLQLVSGRVLMEVRADEGVRFVDVSVTADGTVYALDAQGSRIFRLRPGEHALDVAVALHLTAPTSLAMDDEHVGYVASAEGLSRVDVVSRAVARVAVEDRAADIDVLRASGRFLFALQRAGTGTRLVRFKLDNGGRAIGTIEVLDAALPAATAASVSGDTLYYVAAEGTIRAVKLR